MRPADRFGANLARARRLADVTQQELSVRAEIHRTEISMLERGTRMPRLDTAIKLAASLEVDLEELAEGIDWRPGETRAGGFREGER